MGRQGARGDFSQPFLDLPALSKSMERRRLLIPTEAEPEPVRRRPLKKPQEREGYSHEDLIVQALKTLLNAKQTPERRIAVRRLIRDAYHEIHLDSF